MPRKDASEYPFKWPEDESPELAQAHYEAIGRVASEWASFEATLDTASIHMAQIEPMAGVCFTSQIPGSGRKLDAYIALARLKGADRTVSELNDFAKDAQGLQEQRNRIVHDPWVGLTKPHRLEATARRKLRLEFIPVSTEEVLEVAAKIIALEKRFEALDEKVNLDARDKPPQPSP
jgi:hypothetical protein